MTDSRKKVRGNEGGIVWLEGNTYRWQVTLGYQPDGRRITRSGRSTSEEAAHAAISKMMEERK